MKKKIHNPISITKSNTYMDIYMYTDKILKWKTINFPRKNKFQFGCGTAQILQIVNKKWKSNFLTNEN